MQTVIEPNENQPSVSLITGVSITTKFYAVVAEPAYAHVCRDFSTMIKFINLFERPDYSFENLIRA